MKLLRNIQKIPGGMLIIPMFLSAILATFFPHLFNIGSPTQDLFTSQSTMVLLALILFFSGTQIKLEDLPAVLKQSFWLIFLKLGLATIVSLILMNSGMNSILGVSIVSIIAVVFSINPGFFLSVIDQNNTVDMGTFALLNLFALPTLPLIVLTAQSGFDWQMILSTLLPFLLGILLSFLDEDFKRYFAPGASVIMPFLGFAVGTKINLLNAFQQLSSGIIGTIIFYVLIVLPMVLFEIKVMKQSGKASLGVGTVAGVAVTLPLLMNGVENVETVVAQISLIITLTTIITSILISKFIKS